MIVDSAIYVDGRRSAPSPLEEIHEASRARGGFAWIGLYEPTEGEFDSVAGEFGLHELAIRDAIKPHQRPKVERYGDTLLVVLKAARGAGGAGAEKAGDMMKEEVYEAPAPAPPAVTRRIYDLSREVIQFNQAT